MVLHFFRGHNDVYWSEEDEEDLVDGNSQSGDNDWGDGGGGSRADLQLPLGSDELGHA